MVNEDDAVTLVNLDAMPLGGLRKTVSAQARQPAIYQAFDDLGRLQAEACLAYAGYPVGLYRLDGDVFELTVGVPMDRMFKGFKPYEAPAARALHMRYRGVFSGLGPAFNALYDVVAERGLTPTGYAREIYRIICEDETRNVVDLYLDVETT